MSFIRFLNLTIADDISDRKNVWSFKKQLSDLELVETLFSRFNGESEKLNLILHEGNIIDASFIEVPKQRNKKEENDQVGFMNLIYNMFGKVQLAAI